MFECFQWHLVDVLEHVGDKFGIPRRLLLCLGEDTVSNIVKCTSLGLNYLWARVQNLLQGHGGSQWFVFLPDESVNELLEWLTSGLTTIIDSFVEELRQKKKLVECLCLTARHSFQKRFVISAEKIKRFT